MTNTITSTRRKILYVITKGNWGGAQRYVYDLATRLPRGTFDAAVACGSEGVLTEKLHRAGIRSVVIPSLQRDAAVLKEISALRELIRLFAKEKPDIIHLNSSKVAALGSLASFFVSVSSFLLHILNAKRYALNAPQVVFTVHGWAFNEPRSIAARIAIWLVSALTAFLATDVIVLSHSDSAQAAHMPFVRRKTRLIQNGIARAKMLTREEARGQLAENRRETLPNLWIGAIAELHRNKGIEYLVRAFAELKSPTTLCIIGDGEERARLEALTEKLRIANRVFFAGFKKDAAQYLKAFDIFVLPSLKEGLPYALMEAGTAEIPAVATKLRGIQEIIHGGAVGILVPPKNAAALAEAITRLIENPDERAAVGKNLAARIQKHFSLSEMFRKTEALYLARSV